jgi:hypothetical protein
LRTSTSSTRAITDSTNPVTNCPPATGNTDPQDDGYWLAGSDGGIFTFGNVPFQGSWANAGLSSKVVAVAPVETVLPGEPTRYYVATADGHVYPSPGATFYGDMSATHLNAPIVGMVSVIGGYYLVAADGGVFTFGSAQFDGSLPGEHIEPIAPIVGMSRVGDGYYLVGADGGVFTFGDVQFYGSMANHHLNAPVVGIAQPNGVPGPGEGYWLVAADGGVFTFGPDARFLGSMGNQHLNAPVVGMASGTDIVGGIDSDLDEGYWLVAADGGIFTFGDVPFCGSMGGQRLNAPVVGMAAVFFPADFSI